MLLSLGWVVRSGLGCTVKQLKRYYMPLGPFRAAFVNAGGVMGSLPALEKMFAHVVDNLLGGDGA